MVISHGPAKGTSPQPHRSKADTWVSCMGGGHAILSKQTLGSTCIVLAAMCAATTYIFLETVQPIAVWVSWIESNRHPTEGHESIPSRHDGTCVQESGCHIL
jgi:hypothetical protein